jgi:hypothetical protein
VGLARPVTKGMRVLPQAELDRLHRVHREQEARWSWKAPRRRARVRRYAIGGAVAMLIVNWLFLPGSMLRFYVEVPVYALYGAVIAVRRPGQAEAAGLTVLAGLLACALSGVDQPTLFVMFALLFWIAIGCIVGVDETAKLEMGQDP